MQVSIVTDASHSAMIKSTLPFVFGSVTCGAQAAIALACCSFPRTGSVFVAAEASLACVKFRGAPSCGAILRPLACALPRPLAVAQRWLTPGVHSMSTRIDLPYPPCGHAHA